MKVGDVVSTARWNATVPPRKRISDPARITATRTDRVCESGLMVQLDCDPTWRDSHWYVVKPQSELA